MSLLRIELVAAAGEVGRATLDSEALPPGRYGSTHVPDVILCADRCFVQARAHVDADGVVWVYVESSIHRLSIADVSGDWRAPK